MKIFQNAMDTMVQRGIEIYQIAYYSTDLDKMAARLRPDAVWQKFRRTESIHVYPGNAEESAVFYIAHRHDFMPGFEVEIVQPLTAPTYIDVLDLLPGQIAHLGIRAEEFPGLTDDHIVAKLAPENRGGQMIQKGAVRSKHHLVDHYTIYQVDNFLPVKIVRNKESA